jgi:hypothetical protein
MPAFIGATLLTVGYVVDDFFVLEDFFLDDFFRDGAFFDLAVAACFVAGPALAAAGAMKMATARTRERERRVRSMRESLGPGYRSCPNSLEVGTPPWTGGRPAGGGVPDRPDKADVRRSPKT